MDFDGLCTRLTGLYDVTTTHAAEVANERLKRMVAEAKSLRAIKEIGTTVADQASYSLDPTVVQIIEAKVVYADGQVNYKGEVNISTLWDIDSGEAQVTNSDGYPYWVAIEPDSDSSMTTASFRLYPAPAEDGLEITGLVALRPATITYGSATALPIPTDVEEHLQAGCEAQLSSEEGRQDLAVGFEVTFQAGIRKLSGQEESRGVGSGGHRMRVSGYDFQRR